MTTEPATVPLPVPADQQQPATPDTPTEQRPSVKQRIAAAVSTWWGFQTQPPAIAEVWRRSSKIDPRRVPADSKLLVWAWYWSNRIDRPLLFLFIVTVAPLWAVGPLLHIAERPTRRWALYAVVLLLGLIVPAFAMAQD